MDAARDRLDGAEERMPVLARPNKGKLLDARRRRHLKERLVVRPTVSVVCPCHPFPQELTSIDGRLLFAADDGIHGLELWESDGSVAGARLLQDIQPGPLPSSPHSFTAAGARVYFAAGTEEEGVELWALPPRDGCENRLLGGRFEVSVTWKHDGVERAGRPVVSRGPSE